MVRQKAFLVLVACAVVCTGGAYFFVEMRPSVQIERCNAVSGCWDEATQTCRHPELDRKAMCRVNASTDGAGEETAG